MAQSVEATKRSFFDRAIIEDAVDRAIAKAQSRLGAFVRQRDRSSIRYRNAPAEPGRPPSAHRTGIKLVRPRKTPRPGQTPSGKRQMSSPLRDFLFFSRDGKTKSVVIGPALTNQNSSKRRPIGGATIPQVIEGGGTVQGAKRTYTIRPHPHTKPAFDAEVPGYLDSLKDSIGG